MTEPTFQIRPIAYVRSTRRETVDDNWDAERATIILADGYGEEALAGLDGFSHVDILFLFDRVPLERIETGARHPRGRSDWPMVGIFAQRGKNRPNRIGLTTCRLLRISGRSLEVAGLDAIDGTPVIDIKPVMREFLPRGDISQPAWSQELMAGYWTDAPQ
ncbi:SAM-dependent methyltransferase [Sphingomonas lacunae]|uniref:SAM-dependent methyltransferase n=1 Tax=Sphingomonas lacunae TaxID=2698828 RepID=A0A6M4ASD4_9SPHN|nr:SAM-dependent methyltransferase [Sphingomonas lacunae]QJQ31964.1 SAM-dependent methyltransferase [Sphingomonas lacunae]